MVSLTIMATMTGTYMAPAHFHTTKLQMAGPVGGFLRHYLVSQSSVAGWKWVERGWVGWGAGTQFYDVTKYN